MRGKSHDSNAARVSIPDFKCLFYTSPFVDSANYKRIQHNKISITLNDFYYFYEVLIPSNLPTLLEGTPLNPACFSKGARKTKNTR